MTELSAIPSATSPVPNKSADAWRRLKHRILRRPRLRRRVVFVPNDVADWPNPSFPNDAVVVTTAGRDYDDAYDQTALEEEKGEDTFAAADIHSLKKIFNRKYPIGGKIIWIMIIGTCLMFTLVQVHDRIRHFLQEPVASSIQIKRNATMALPYVTLCSRQEFSTPKVTKMIDELARRRSVPSNNVSVYDLIDEYGALYMWKNAGYKIPEMMVECFVLRTKKCHKMGKWMPVLTVMGICYTFMSDVQTAIAGPYQSLYFSLQPDGEQDKDAKGWKMLVHHSDENPEIAVRTEGLTLYADTRTDVVVELRQFETLNTAAKPCNTNKSYSATTCVADCLYRIVAANATCRLPHMNLQQYPMCDSGASYKLAMDQQAEKIGDGVGWDPAACPCPRQCKEMFFNTKTDMRYYLNDGNLIARVYYQDFSYELVQETAAYGLVSLFSDIGGILGLFLGACLLTIFEVLEAAVVAVKKKVVRCCLREKRRRAMETERRHVELATMQKN